MPGPRNHGGGWADTRHVESANSRRQNTRPFDPQSFEPTHVQEFSDR